MNHSSLKTSIEDRIGSLDNSPSEPWFKSSVPYYAFGRTANPQTSVSFAVGILATEPITDRQIKRDGMWLETDFGVKVAYRMAPSAQNESEGYSWQAVDKVISKLLERDSLWSVNKNVKFESATTSLSPSGEYIISDLKFTVGHLFPIDSSVTIE